MSGENRKGRKRRRKRVKRIGREGRGDVKERRGRMSRRFLPCRKS